MRLRGTLVTIAAFFAGICIVLNTGLSIRAQTEGANSAFKIGIVNLQEAMDHYKKREVEVAKLEQEFKELEGQLSKMADEFEAEKERYKEEKDSLTDAEREERQTKLDKAFLELETESRRIEAEFARRQNRLKQSLLRDLVAAIEQVGAEGNYHLVLEADPESRTGVMYYSPTMKITQRVVDRLNSGV